ncbi:palmitoyltransferase ZDHHC11 isoform X1 [Chiloscyllium plagiosum]|uniref:palmitoyltransferase ZDHHC11 isoform X1 n=2 Tax=Chiloscyllium plagiosum TaxID=36176 RepID=UPI001CB7BC75|nr:palmitoyltransferase ZDHHC11 isoform X1 [Chiloscyllium plagiosum]
MSVIHPTLHYPCSCGAQSCASFKGYSTVMGNHYRQVGFFNHYFQCCFVIWHWMNCYDRRLRKTGPERENSRNDLVTPPTRSRVNGWTLPLHSFQLIAFVLYFYLAVVAFGIYIPMLPYAWKYAGYAIIGTLFVYHFIVHLVAVSIDPADSSVRTRKNYNTPMPTLDRAKHPHVIQNQHCYLCEVDVGVKAKHCSTCNKCISDFDHHCKWLNNCVGGRNYWFFFHTVVSAVLGILMIVLVTLYVFIQQFVNPEELRTAPQFENVRGNNTWLVFLPIAPVETTQTGISVIAGITIILGLASLMLLGHLLGFHIYLLFNKLSTYEYVVRERHKQDVRGQGSDVESAQNASARMTALQGLPVAKSQGEAELAASSRSSALKYQDQGPVANRLSNSICLETSSVSTATSSSHTGQVLIKRPKSGVKGDGHIDETKFTSERTSTVSSIPEPLDNSDVTLQTDHKGTQGSHRRSLESIEEIPIVQNPLGSAAMDNGHRDNNGNTGKCLDASNHNVLLDNTPGLLVNPRDSVQLSVRSVGQQPTRTSLVRQDRDTAHQRHGQLTQQSSDVGQNTVSG